MTGRSCSGAGIRLGAVARHLPHGQGLQAIPHHRGHDRRPRSTVGCGEQSSCVGDVLLVGSFVPSLPPADIAAGTDTMRNHPTIPIQPWRPILAGPSFPVLESKLAPAPGRPGIVPRGDLLDRLEASAATPVVAICAPAGYGKTVLAAAWAKRDPRPFVWLSVDRQDNDPAVLLTYI